jgi:outer membrane scaffolding protein for murein synthesis (MipA/OmpV family)
LRSALAASVLAAASLACATAAARDEPLWEAGIGAAALHFPDYRGSEQSHTYGLPAPYFVYRGEILKADRHGIRGTLFNSDWIDLNLSVGASLPVDSSKNRAREGMSDLKPSVELGPSLDITLWRAADRRAKLDFRLPLRGAITVESDPRFIGGQLFPHINIDIHDPLGFGGWNLGVLAGPVFTDSRHNSYFYSVPAQYATAARPAYDSPGGGFAGTEFIVAVSKRFRDFWVGGFMRYDTLKGAKFEESPLVTSKRYLAGGIGVSWIFGRSAQRVPVNEYGDAPK